MIRINLLGSPKPKGKKNVAVSMPSMDLGNLGGPLVQVAAVLLIAGAVNGDARGCVQRAVATQDGLNDARYGAGGSRDGRLGSGADHPDTPVIAVGDV